jgi:hypothetical protein
VAISIEIVIPCSKLFRIRLHESAQLGVIHPVPVIVQLQVAQILAPGEEEAVTIFEELSG